MRLIINISEETYSHIRNGGNIGASLMIENAIKNGTPLLKGHGELIERLTKCAESFPNDFSEKIYDAATIYEGIQEVSSAGTRKGLEMAIGIIKTYCGLEESNADSN